MTLTDTLLILLLLIAMNAFLALAELSIASAKRIKLMQIRDSREPDAAGAAEVLYLKDNPNGFLGIVQIGLNVVAILAGVFGEAAFSMRIADVLA